MEQNKTWTSFTGSSLPDSHQGADYVQDLPRGDDWPGKATPGLTINFQCWVLDPLQTCPICSSSCCSQCALKVPIVSNWTLSSGISWGICWKPKKSFQNQVDQAAREHMVEPRCPMSRCNTKGAFCRCDYCINSCCDKMTAIVVKLWTPLFEGASTWRRSGQLCSTQDRFNLNLNLK